MIDGSRVPFTLTLDEHMVEVSLLRDHEAYNKVVYGEADAVSSRMTLWATPEVPNPIPGTDDLRGRFIVARRDIEKRVVAGECKPCEIGKLIKRYRVILEERGLLP